MIVPGTSDFEDNPIPPSTSLLKRISNFIFCSPHPKERDSIVLANNYNLVKISVSIGQIVFAIGTLYLTRGDQISLFGYAAFGLTVVPYAWMSLINLLGNILCPQYSTLFLVKSKSLDELMQVIISQGKEDEFPIEGAVGRITPESEKWAKNIHRFIVEMLRTPRQRLPKGISPLTLKIGTPGTQRKFYYTALSTPIIGLAITLLIMGTISRFSPGSSAVHQRVWIMLWYVCGTYFGSMFSMLLEVGVECRNPVLGFTLPRKVSILRRILSLIVSVGLLGSLIAPAIGGFVVVGQMIMQYGTCFEI